MPSPLCTIAICNTADDFRRPQTTFYVDATEDVWYSTDGATFVCGDSLFPNFKYLYQSQASVRHIMYPRYTNTVASGGFRCKTQSGTSGAANNNVMFVLTGYFSATTFTAFYIGKDGNVYYYFINGGTVISETNMGASGTSYSSPVQWEIVYPSSGLCYPIVNGTRIGGSTYSCIATAYVKPGFVWNACTGYASDAYWYLTYPSTENIYHAYFYLEGYDTSPSLTVNSIRIPSGVGSRIQTANTDNRTITISGTYLRGKTGSIDWNPTIGWANPINFISSCADNNIPMYIRTPAIETAGIIKSYSDVKYTKGAGSNIGKFSITLIEQRGGLRRS